MNRKSVLQSTRGAGLLLVLISLLGIGCSERERPKAEARMGEPALAGSLSYNVIEAQWRSQLQSFPTPRFPERQFFLIKVSVTNSGNADASIPFLTLESPSGDSYKELENGAGVDGWLGVLRRVGPAQTEEGWILFDVPTNTYKLRLSDGNVERERVTYVTIPLSMDSVNPTVQVQ
jgi:hypothetical protein